MDVCNGDMSKHITKSGKFREYSLYYVKKIYQMLYPLRNRWIIPINHIGRSGSQSVVYRCQFTSELIGKYTIKPRYTRILCLFIFFPSKVRLYKNL